MSKIELQQSHPIMGHDPALLVYASLSNYVGLGRSRIYDLIAKGEFPAPIKIGKSSRWVKAEIDSWLSEQIAARQHLRAAA